ncbi:MAG: pYEATS domain-containing protein [Gemmataceae bacterium]
MADAPTTDGDVVVVAEEEPRWQWVRRGLFVALALALVGLGVARVAGATQADEKVLYFLAAAGLVLMLERVTEFTVGKDGVTAKLARQAYQLAQANRKIVSGEAGGKPAGAVPAGDPLAAVDGRAVDPNDRNKGQFGGSPTANGWTVEVGGIKPLPGELCQFVVRVSRQAAGRPAAEAILYLHDSFRVPERRLAVGAGVASETIVAYGGFTLGVEVKDGQTPPTRLELDLANDTRFPQWFRER